MNRSHEVKLAWALAGLAEGLHSLENHTWLCVRIGTGELQDAIIELLCLLAEHDVELPEQLDLPLSDWVAGYAGSDRESALSALAVRLRVSGPQEPPSVANAAPVPWQQRPRRIGIGVRNPTG